MLFVGVAIETTLTEVAPQAITVFVAEIVGTTVLLDTVYCAEVEQPVAVLVTTTE